MKNYRFRVLDLFSGAGGFSFGLEQNNNFNCCVAVDFNEAALKTYRKNMPHCECICGDITERKIKDLIINKSKQNHINMIVGGPPCQGFSLKGKKLGLNDPRNFLFREYLNLVKELDPEVFVIENVKSLLSTANGYFKKQIIEEVKNLGYEVSCSVLLASDFGVPQNRERTIFICCKEKRIEMPKPTVKKKVTVRDAISDLAYLESGEGLDKSDYVTEAQSQYQKFMRRNSLHLYNHKASNHKEIAIKKLKLIPPECGKEYLPENMKGKQVFNTTWGRLKWDEPSPTIDTRFDACSNGTNNHPFLNRAITPREAARLQSFSDNFIFVGSKVQIRTQIGNAVPPLMAKAIADKILKDLGE